MSGNDNNTAGEQKQDQPLFGKGMTLEKLMSKFDDKLSKEKAKAFEQKFAAKYKELDTAEAIVRTVQKELEKMYTEFSESL